MPVAHTPFDYAARLVRVRQMMAEQGIDLLFVPPSAALQYLTGITRPHPTYGNTNYNGGWVHAALIGREGAPILSLPRMATIFATFPADVETVILPDTGDPDAHIRRLLGRFGVVKKIAVESRTRSEALLHLQMLLPEATFVAADPLLTALRRIKSEDEIAVLRHAADIIDRTHAHIVRLLKPGMRYSDIAAEIDRKMVELGAETQSFPTTLIPMGATVAPTNDPWSAGGERSSDGDRMLQSNMSLSFDYGSVFDGYCNDFGRAVWIGDPPAEYRRVYDLVIGAQEEARKAMRAGAITGEGANHVARTVIERDGYGEHFFHRLGHGIGLDVHEPCYLSEGDTTTLEAGMTFTIEPSIFIPGRFGARIEDVFVVTADGAQPLNQYPRQLEVIG